MSTEATHKEFKVIYGDILVTSEDGNQTATVNKLYDVQVLPEALINVMTSQVPDDWCYVVLGKFKGSIIYKSNTDENQS